MIPVIDIALGIYLLICFITFLVLARTRKAYRDDSKKYFEGEQKEHVLQEKIKIEKIKARRQVDTGYTGTAIGAVISMVIGVGLIVLVIVMVGSLGGVMNDAIGRSINSTSAMNRAIGSMQMVTSYMPIMMTAVVGLVIFGGVISFMGGRDL